MTVQDKLSAYIVLHIRDCPTCQSAYRSIEKVFSQNKCDLRLEIVDYENHKRNSRVGIALLGKINEHDLISIFESRASKFHLERIEIVEGNNVQRERNSVCNSSDQLKSVHSNSDESLLKKKKKYGQLDAERTECSVQDVADEQSQSWGNISVISEGKENWSQVNNATCSEQSYFVKQSRLLMLNHISVMNDSLKNISEDNSQMMNLKAEEQNSDTTSAQSGHSDSSFIIPFTKLENFAVKTQSRFASDSAVRKVYGEPPDVFIGDLLEKLMQMKNNRPFTEENAGINRLAYNNSGERSHNPRWHPSPPWQKTLSRVRGKFTSETNKLSMDMGENELNSEKSAYIESEIRKRNCRLEIFEKIHAKHLEMLKQSPDAAEYINELMEHEIKRFAHGLPIYNARLEIKRILCTQARVLVVVAETGSGKSTQIPQYLVLDGVIHASKKLLCTQPRKISVQALTLKVNAETALRHSNVMNNLVDKNWLQSDASGKILFVTEKQFLNLVKKDQTLSPYGCVLIDEVHERTLNTDMCLGMMKEVLRAREDMKLVICSASVDPTPIVDYFAEFGAQKLEAAGRQFPIEIKYLPPTKNEGVRSLKHDYVSRTVSKVMDICEAEANKKPFMNDASLEECLTRAGHILAFLSSPYETLASEEHLRGLLLEKRHAVQVKVVSLYGDMPEESRAEIFAPLESSYHHMVVFATNVGEASITIPGVRYVVDCGLAKMKKFKSPRQSSIVELGLISKTAAIQRAGRAGRTAPGVCYRLYSKEQYEMMESLNTPRILITNLCEVVLYMLSAGIRDPTKFDFINKPKEGMLAQSEMLLRSLKAIDSCENMPVLTVLGENMRYFPVEPRLVKMIVDSVDYNLVAETAVIAACIHFGAPFRRGREENNFVFADQKKLSFCEDSGDPMTFLAVYSQYIQIPRFRLKGWCANNFVSMEYMDAVRKFAYRICKVVSELGYASDMNIKLIDLERARKYIPGLYCRSFGRNLAVYSGVPQQGYYDFNEEKYMMIHPSSAMKYSELTPEFIVYECSVQTTNEFVLNVCTADPNWLQSIDQNVLLGKNKGKVVLYNVNYGTTVKNWIKKNMDRLRKEVGMECFKKGSADDPYRRLQICVSVLNLEKLETFVKRNAESLLNKLCRKTKEIPIMHSNYVLHMAGSGEPLEIIMPGEFCSLYVGDKDVDSTNNASYKDDVEGFCGKFGEIMDFVTFRKEVQKNTGHTYLIRMESKEVAQRILAYNRENSCGFHLEPCLGRKSLGRTGSYRPCAYRLVITWWRRPSYGLGHIKLKSRDFDERLYAFDVISKHLGNFQPSLLSEDLMERDSNVNVDDLHKIILRSLPLGIGNRQLREIMEPLLKSYDIGYEDMYVLRKKAYPVDDDKALETYARRITEYIVNVAKNANITLMPFLNDSELKELNSDNYPFEVKVRAPKRENEIEFVAFVLFNDLILGKRVGDAVLQAVENGIFLEMGRSNYTHNADIRQMFHYQMEVPKPLFSAIYDDLCKIYENVNHELIDFGHFMETRREISHVFVSGLNLKAVNEVKAAVDKVIDGYTFNCKDGEDVDGINLPCGRLLTRVGQDFLRQLSQRPRVFLNISPYKMEVKIQGSVATVDCIKHEIKSFLLQWPHADLKEVLTLEPPLYRQGTLKALLARNNYDINAVRQKLGGNVYLAANITKRQLRFSGKECQYQQLLAMLRNISDSIESADSMGTPNHEKNKPPECVVCLCNSDIENYCLEACGHYVCQQCMNMQIKTVIETRGFPIACVGCAKPLTWNDLEVILFGKFDRDKQDDPQRLQALADASLAYFIERHGDLYKHCATPDCRGLHPVTKEPALGRCKLCGRLQCTRCGKEEHDSMSCEEYARLRVNADESIRKWIREDQKSRRICANPKCQIPIEKFGGCNHMQCSQCKIHFCWVCMYTADESKDIYAHMENKHGGSGADMNELIQAMDNDPFIREFIAEQHPELLIGREGRFNFQEDAAIWIMPEEDVLIVDDNELHNFFELQQEVVDGTDSDIEFRNDYLSDEDFW